MLEHMFFKSFFYPFLVSVFLSTLVVTIFLGCFTNNNYDKKTRQNIIDLGKKFSKISINSANVLLSSMLLKLKVGLNEQIIFYQKIAKDLLKDEKSHKLIRDNLISAVNIDPYFCENNNDIIYHTAVWLLDEETTEDNFDDSKREAKLQLISFSNIISSIDSILKATMPNTYSYFLYFDKTEFYASYPLSVDCDYEFADIIAHYPYYEDLMTTCMNEKGEYYYVYKTKCQGFYINMLKSRTSVFDNNYSSSKNKTIFVNNYYYVITEEAPKEFTMCIEFDDPISKGKGYICVDYNFEEIAISLDNLNSNIIGYFFISNIGFNNVFYFPYSKTSAKVANEEIFNLNIKYRLEEKIYFFDYINKIITSNYIDNIGNNIFDEVFINGKNSSKQYFSLNREKYNYSIFPVLIENLNGHKEHIFSIIYVYNDNLYLEEMKTYTSSISIKIILELILFFVFGSGLLYLLNLIKFKFKKSSKGDKSLDTNNRGHPEFKKKLDFKKKIFDKIVKWFNVFDDYISYIKDNSSLNDIQSILKDYFKRINSNNNEFDLESQSTLIFRVNIQKSNFLKGKFCLYCKNYTDALFYFIRAAKKETIVLDGLIKKRSLKHIYKILTKMDKKFEELRLKNLDMEKEMKEYKRNKNRINNKKFKIGRKRTNRSIIYQGINTITFGEEMGEIEQFILENIRECNSKKEKDILILIDFNNYNNQEENIFKKSNTKLDLFIEQTIEILNNYLSPCDRLCVFIYTNEYKIICPLMSVEKIDVNSFSKDLVYYKNIYFKEKYEHDEYDINFNDFINKDIELNLLGKNNISEQSQEDSVEISDKEENNYQKITGLVNTINHINKHSRMKDGIKNEKYFILFTNLLN